MGIYIVILIFSFLIFLAFLSLLVWSIKNGQLDDLKTPSERILWEDLPDDR